MYLARKAVRWERTAPYVHEEVAYAERRNGMLIPMARTLLIRAGMALRHWAAACRHACWLLNRTPTRSRDDRWCTPYENRYGEKPDLRQRDKFKF